LRQLKVSGFKFVYFAGDGYGIKLLLLMLRNDKISRSDNLAVKFTRGS